MVVIDPGHNGGNIDHLAQVNRLVDAGHGERKPCNEIGAETATGYAEHAFTWDVAVRLRSLLAARGLDVRLTRSSDHGVGPCVDVRGRFGNVVKADAVVSVHADGGPASGTGFHVIEAARPAGDKADSTALALAVRKAMLAGSGLRYATYIAGGDGLDVRDDLAGLTLSGRPTVMVEAGNMANRADAALQASAAGRQRVAAALAKDGGLGQRVAAGGDAGHASLRRLVCDMLEEYGRHTGHADMLREAVDGMTGEDPPDGWRPKSGHYRLPGAVG